MNEIIAQLHRPEWWFSAVFVAVLAGVAAILLRDLAGTTVAHFSRRYSARRERKKQQRLAWIEMLTKDPHLLVIENIKVVGALTVFFSSIFLALLIPIWILVADRYPEIDPLRMPRLLPRGTWSSTMTLALIACAVWSEFLFARLVINCVAARRKYMRRPK